MKTIETQVSDELHKEIKEYCKKANISLRDFISIALKNEMERKRKWLKG